VDILVATPGRLVDHLESTPGFSLEHLRFLVLDEADRLLSQHYQDWMHKVMSAAYAGQPGRAQTLPDGTVRIVETTVRVRRPRPGQVPFQRLLFSATLSDNPGKLAGLQLRNPVLFTEAPPDAKAKYKIPQGLTELMSVCRPGDKPLVLLLLLRALREKQGWSALVFTSSVDATHRLFRLVNLWGGLAVAEYSSSLPQEARTKIVNNFKAGKIQVVICSDAMARGMDIQDVRVVINYDAPVFARTYIHRVGRTARAGQEGLAITLLRRKDVKHFKEMLAKAEHSNRLKQVAVPPALLEPLVPHYQACLHALKDVLAEERRGNVKPSKPVPALSPPAPPPSADELEFANKKLLVMRSQLLAQRRDDKQGKGEQAQQEEEEEEAEEEGAGEEGDEGAEDDIFESAE